MLNHTKINKLVTRCASRYRARCWWADEEDLRQVGWETALKALRTWDERVGVPAEAYVWRACVFAMRRYLWRESSPVSGGLSNPREHRRGLRASLDHPDMLNMRHPSPSPDALLAEKEWTESVLQALQRHTKDTHVEVGLRVLLGTTPVEVAQKTGLERACVYKASAEARREVAYDQELWLLAEEAT